MDTAYTLYYDLNQTPFTDINPNLLWLTLPVYTLITYFILRALGRLDKIVTCIAIIFLFALSFLVPVFINSHNEEKILRERLVAGKIETVQGVIEEFHPISLSGRNFENFRVKGVYFEYSESERNAMFGKALPRTQSLLANGMAVRIKYHGKRILRFETKQPK
jgi:hypothetical protein